MTDYNDQHYQETMQRIRGLRLIDDVFMTVCFDGNIEGARYHSSMLDSNMLAHGENWADIKESYVIFITENDVLGLNKPIYHIDRYISECGCLPFNDGEHIIYVNGEMKGSDTALAKLMSDFFCTEAKDMNYKELSEKVKYFKESEEGVEHMIDSLEDMRNEAVSEATIEYAKKMIARGKLTLEEIAEDLGLPLDKVKALAESENA